MRAVRIHAYGGPSVIHVDEIPVPVPRPNEVLVRTAATSFNPSEVGLRMGLLRGMFDLPLPHTLGWDLAGTVEATGERLVGHVDGGAAAQYVAADRSLLVAAPTTVPLEQAAALPVAGLTAWQAVFDHGRVRPGERVLVNGAGGGIGGFAVQLARHAGAQVVATASGRSAAKVRSLGAGEVLDYTSAPLDALLSAPVDVLLHLAPAPVPAGVLRPGGRLVSATTPGPDHFVMRNDPGQLAALVELVDTGVVSLDISDTVDFDGVAAVHRAAEAGEVRGKVLIVPELG
ncbi:NADP-dependent oxidoreductase [Dactylosporangium sp. AC04546]|uniref:NADP-dependent oxidoreductase n=1 Tax=Dactylosporangium sp. AC04546 TaxID=2862460 RepID=UPI001EDCD2E2|nr:NADP-dependent oxidoreductase [Dactylosporangium sp. AC04546]WVK80101.1 NADP-dependent oxidoreductase [Dactylosporangium sp. AC04546]